MHEFLWEIWVGRGNMHHRVTMDLNDSPTVIFQRIIQELEGTEKTIKTSMLNPNTGEEERTQWEFSCRVKGEEWPLKDNDSFARQGVVEGAMLVVRAKTIRANTIYVEGYDGLDDEQMAVARSKTPLIVASLILLVILGAVSYYIFVLRPKEAAREPYRVKVATLPDTGKVEFLLVSKTKERGKDGKFAKWPNGSFKMMDQTRRLEQKLGKSRIVLVPKKVMIGYALIEAKGKATWQRGASFEAWSKSKVIDRCLGRKCYTRAVLKQHYSKAMLETLKTCKETKECGDGSVCSLGFCAKSCSDDSACGTNGVCQDKICMAKLEPFDAKLMMDENFFPKQLKKFVPPPKPRGPKPVATHAPKSLTVAYKKRLKRARVVFDPMHGGSDKGATGIGSKTAKDYNLLLSEALRAHLNNNRKRKRASRIKAYYTRLKDGVYSAKNRVRSLRRRDVLIQFNVANGLSENKATNQKDKGNEYNDTIAGFQLVVQGPRKVRGRRARRYEKKRMQLSVKLARCLSDSLKKAGFRMKPTTGSDILSKAGIQASTSDSLLNNAIPAVRVSLGYITHRKEAAVLANTDTHKAFASAVEDALSCYRK